MSAGCPFGANRPEAEDLSLAPDCFVNESRSVTTPLSSRIFRTIRRAIFNKANRLLTRAAQQRRPCTTVRELLIGTARICRSRGTFDRTKFTVLTVLMIGCKLILQMATASVQVINRPPRPRSCLRPSGSRCWNFWRSQTLLQGSPSASKLPRQTVNYHLRELEKEGFVELVECRLKGNCLERLVRAKARSYVISPAALGALGTNAAELRDQFSSAYLVSATARAIRDVSLLRQRAGKAGRKLATLTIESEVRFASPQSRKEFTDELLNLVGRLVIKYHNDKAEGGRSFRVLLAGYPLITKQEPVDGSPVTLE
jgi:hypothetical protein